MTSSYAMELWPLPRNIAFFDNVFCFMAAAFTLYADGRYINQQLFKICDTCGFKLPALKWLYLEIFDCWNPACHGNDIQILMDITFLGWFIVIVWHVLIVVMIVTNFKLLRYKENVIPENWVIKEWASAHAALNIFFKWLDLLADEQQLGGYFSCLPEGGKIFIMITFILSTKAYVVSRLGTNHKPEEKNTQPSIYKKIKKNSKKKRRSARK